MLIKRLWLVIIATMASTGLVAADLNRLVAQYGVQNNSLTRSDLNLILEECRNVGNWDIPVRLPYSSILRAQFSEDTTLNSIGTTSAISRLFPNNTESAANSFKKLLAADSSPSSRRQAISEIKDLLTKEEQSNQPSSQPERVPNRVTQEAIEAPEEEIIEVAPAMPVEEEVVIEQPYRMNPGMVKWLENRLRGWDIEPTGDLQTDINLSHKGTGLTPLMNAAHEGYDDIVEGLIRQGANPNAVNRSGERAIDLVPSGNDSNLVKIRQLLTQ